MTDEINQQWTRNKNDDHPKQKKEKKQKKRWVRKYCTFYNILGTFSISLW